MNQKTKHNIDVLVERLKHVQKIVLPRDETDLRIIKWYPYALRINVVRNLNREIIGYLAWKEIGFFNRKACISSFAVLPEYQNRGLGSELLLFSFKQMRERGLEVVEVGTWRTNNNALRFYLKHGFEIESLNGNNIGLFKHLNT